MKQYDIIQKVAEKLYINYSTTIRYLSLIEKTKNWATECRMNEKKYQEIRQYKICTSFMQ